MDDQNNAPETSAVATASTNALAPVSAPPVNTFGLGASDIMVPIVLLMQSISKAVKDRLCFAGDFWDSLDEKVIGKPIEFIPVGYFKQIHTYEDNIKVRSEAWSHKLELELMAKGYFSKEPVVIAGVRVAKSISQNYYAVLVQDIVDMVPFPKVIRFVKTSAKAGKNLSTHIMKLEDFGHKPWAKTFLLNAAEEKGEKGEYSVMKVSMGRTTTPDEIAIAQKWHGRLAVEQVTIHEGAEEIDESFIPQGQAEPGRDVKADANVNF